jgi:DNA-binding response OmpR family regulator
MGRAEDIPRSRCEDRARDRAQVLVLDDDPDALTFIGKLLLDLPVDAVPTASCASARYAFETLGPFDVFIADQVLPDGDGVALAAEMAAKYGCRTVVMSGNDAPGGRLPEGIDLWIMKPVDLMELKAAVETLSGGT